MFNMISNIHHLSIKIIGVNKIKIKIFISFTSNKTTMHKYYRVIKINHATLQYCNRKRKRQYRTNRHS